MSRLCRSTHQEIAPGLRRVADGGWLPDVPLQLLHVQGEFLTPCPKCGMCSVKMYHAAGALRCQPKLLLSFLSVASTCWKQFKGLQRHREGSNTKGIPVCHRQGVQIAPGLVMRQEQL